MLLVRNIRLPLTCPAPEAEAAAQGIQFTDQETSLLVSILAADMAPADQKKLSVLRMFSRKFF